jgi:hypothetical protein
MKPGDLAVITVPIPSLFESIGTEPTRVMQRGDLVILLRHEPTRWYWPCWQVLYDGQLGVIASRWLKIASETERFRYLDDDMRNYDRS